MIFSSIVYYFFIIPALISIYGTYRLYSSYKKTKNQLMEYFSGFFVCKAAFFIIILVPVLLSVGDLSVLGISFALGLLFISFSQVFIAAILFSIILTQFRKIAVFLAIAAVIVINLLNIVNYISPILDPRTGILQTYMDRSAGIALGLEHIFISGVLALIFIFKGLKITEKFARIRSILLGVGLFLVSSLALIVPFLKNPTQMLIFPTLCAVAYLVLLAGLLYKGESSLD